MPVDVILGLQWGDEGKGKIVDYLADRYKIVCRFQGGPNAGHTLYINGEKLVLHTIPSGIFREQVVNIIGNGVVADPITFRQEVNRVEPYAPHLKEKLFFSQKAHLILPTHRWIDLASENSKGKQKIGSTLRGIGPCYMDKTGRNGLRIGDIHQTGFRAKYRALKEKHLQFIRQFPEVEFDIHENEEAWFESLELIRQFQCLSTEYYLNDEIRHGAQILAEGAQGTMLDVDFGTYPFVTSSNTITAGVCTGLGVPPSSIREVIGIAKAYCTRVGSGPFPSELMDATGEQLRRAGNEFGSTTGRPRRCGWLDLLQLQYAVMINGVTGICLTKIDVLNDFEQVCLVDKYQLSNGELSEALPYSLEEVSSVEYSPFEGWKQSLSGLKTYAELPHSAQELIRAIELHSRCPINYVSTGPGREDLLIREVTL